MRAQSKPGTRRRFTLLLSMAVLAITTILAGTTGATAETAPAAAPIAVVVPHGDVTVLAWECPSGDFCVWENPHGMGRRCNWDVADPDWQGGAIRCSWSATLKVESALDNGNDPRFAAVAVYQQANYMSTFGCFDRGTPYEVTNDGVLLRSHKWVTAHC